MEGFYRKKGGEKFLVKEKKGLFQERSLHLGGRTACLIMQITPSPFREDGKGSCDRLSYP